MPDSVMKPFDFMYSNLRDGAVRYAYQKLIKGWVIRRTEEQVVKEDIGTYSRTFEAKLSFVRQQKKGLKKVYKRKWWKIKF